MRRKPLIGLTTAVCLCTAASSAYAHHSHPYFYDECNSITIEGRVERVEFKDPHTRIVLRLDDGTAYTVDWAPLSRLTNDRIIGPAKEALVFGARVVVTGNRLRDAAPDRVHDLSEWWNSAHDHPGHHAVVRFGRLEHRGQRRQRQRAPHSVVQIGVWALKNIRAWRAQSTRGLGVPRPFPRSQIGACGTHP
jgi:hypothetical protein